MNSVLRCTQPEQRTGSTQGVAGSDLPSDCTRGQVLTQLHPVYFWTWLAWSVAAAGVITAGYGRGGGFSCGLLCFDHCRAVLLHYVGSGCDALHAHLLDYSIALLNCSALNMPCFVVLVSFLPAQVTIFCVLIAAGLLEAAGLPREAD